MTNFEQAARTALKGLAASGDFLFNWHDCDPDNAAEMQAYATARAAITKATIALEEALDALAQHEQVCDKDPQGCWSVRCQLGKVCKNTSTLASKPWVRLTEDEIENIWEGSTVPILRKEYINLARAIEAKLKKKNT